MTEGPDRLCKVKRVLVQRCFLFRQLEFPWGRQISAKCTTLVSANSVAFLSNLHEAQNFLTFSHRVFFALSLPSSAVFHWMKWKDASWYRYYHNFWFQALFRAQGSPSRFWASSIFSFSALYFLTRGPSLFFSPSESFCPSDDIQRSRAIFFRKHFSHQRQKLRQWRRRPTRTARRWCGSSSSLLQPLPPVSHARNGQITFFPARKGSWAAMSEVSHPRFSKGWQPRRFTAPASICLLQLQWGVASRLTFISIAAVLSTAFASAAGSTSLIIMAAMVIAAFRIALSGAGKGCEKIGSYWLRVFLSSHQASWLTSSNRRTMTHASLTFRSRFTLLVTAVLLTGVLVPKKRCLRLAVARGSWLHGESRNMVNISKMNVAVVG